MKIVKGENDNLVIYQSKYQIDAIDFRNHKHLEDQFRTLFLKLKQFYDVDVNGYFNIDVYTDSKFGKVMEIEKEPIEYIEYLDNQIDMRIVLHEEEDFFYEVEDIFSIPSPLNKKLEFYSYKNKIYAKMKKKFTDLEIGRLLELTNIKYQNNSYLLKRGKVII